MIFLKDIEDEFFKSFKLIAIVLVIGFGIIGVFMYNDILGEPEKEEDKPLQLTWDDTDGADSYNLYWSKNPNITTANGNKVYGVKNPYTIPFKSGTYYLMLTGMWHGSETNPTTPLKIIVP